MTSYTLHTCKSHTYHNKEAGKHAVYNNELYMTWYYLVKGSYDNSDYSEAITIQSVIFRKPRNCTKTVTYLNKINLHRYKIILYHIISQTLISQYTYVYIVCIAHH